VERSNRETIARLGEVEVVVLAHLPALDIAALERAGETLPWRRWLIRERGRPGGRSEDDPGDRRGPG
jgi:hypothetical protein